MECYLLQLATRIRSDSVALMMQGRELFKVLEKVPKAFG